MKRGFTLLEIIVVIIIIGILAAIAFTQYTQVIEKGRTSEAKATLGSIRTLNIAYFQEYGTYGTITNLGSPVLDGACDTNHYFSYSCTTGGNGVCTATRCTSGGKNPQGTSAYTLTLDAATATFGGTAGYY